MAEEFRHDREANRYEVLIDGRAVGEAHYELTGDVAAFDHTEVLPEVGGRGVAGRLVRYAMDDVRAAGRWRVRAVCPYVVHWFDRNPGYADLLA
ncbi:MAG: N-acetyltransferase [Actinobacteria bacterium]|nr:N-acetyltransferase [Actinomycetota bacterium]